MKLSDFDYDLPDSYIAQAPAEPRDSSRLMIVNRRTGAIEHRVFRDIINYVNPGDVLVINTTRVIPARLNAFKHPTGGRIELLLLRQVDDTRWHVLAGGRKTVPGLRLTFPGTPVYAEIVEVLGGSERIVKFSEPVNDLLERLGEMPLPPYIHTRLADAERYQTIYGKQKGSAAAPTAGLHFTTELLAALREKGVKTASCVLHVGLDTFQPVRVENILDHHMHSESAYLSPENAEVINQARATGGRVIAVGTTTTRTLESAAVESNWQPLEAGQAPYSTPTGRMKAFEGNTELFIYPGYRWRVIDALITNFHLPKSTLLMMISAFASREIIANAYETAKQTNYRFFSFGDAMFIS